MTNQWFDWLCLYVGRIVMIAGGFAAAGMTVWVMVDVFCRRMRLASAFIQFVLARRKRRKGICRG